MLFVFIYSFFHALMHSTLPHCFAFVFFFFLLCCFLLVIVPVGKHSCWTGEPDDTATVDRWANAKVLHSVLFFCFHFDWRWFCGERDSRTAEVDRTQCSTTHASLHLAIIRVRARACDSVVNCWCSPSTDYFSYIVFVRSGSQRNCSSASFYTSSVENTAENMYLCGEPTKKMLSLSPINVELSRHSHMFVI